MHAETVQPAIANDYNLATFWQHEIDRWQQSDLSQAQFCKRNHLIYRRFVYWRQKLTNKDDCDQRDDTMSTRSSGFAAVAAQPIMHASLHPYVRLPFLNQPGFKATIAITGV